MTLRPFVSQLSIVTAYIAFAFVGADIYGRVQRLQGRDVFEPIGFCINQFGGVTHSFNTGGTRSGWLVGYGTDDLGRNWSAKAEYDYIDLGSRTSDGVTTGTAAPSLRSRSA